MDRCWWVIQDIVLIKCGGLRTCMVKADLPWHADRTLQKRLVLKSRKTMKKTKKTPWKESTWQKNDLCNRMVQMARDSWEWHNWNNERKADEARCNKDSRARSARLKSQHAILWWRRAGMIVSGRRRRRRIIIRGTPKMCAPLAERS